MTLFYCDEDVRVEVAAFLIQTGHRAWTTVGERRLGAWDSDQLRYASDHGWTLITHNRRDFHTSMMRGRNGLLFGVNNDHMVEC